MLENLLQEHIEEELKRKFVIDSLRQGMNALSTAITAFHELGMYIDAQFFEEYFAENPEPTMEELIGLLLLNAEIELDAWEKPN
jgi:hypothetical protein